MYFDDMDIAQSIVAASKKGQKQVIVGDYSNWFPARMQQAIDLAKKTGKPLPEQTPAMKLVIANLGPNLELHILKGLGSIGINHNKFTVYTGADGAEFLQIRVPSSTTRRFSQLNHWENVIFTNDADRISFYNVYHAWILRRARPYSPDLQPQEPVMDPKDPKSPRIDRAEPSSSTACRSRRATGSLERRHRGLAGQGRIAGPRDARHLDVQPVPDAEDGGRDRGPARQEHPGAPDRRPRPGQQVQAGRALPNPC